MRDGLPARAAAATWMIFGTAAAALSQYFIVVILARQATPTAVGQYALGLAIGTPVSLLTALGLRTVLVTDSAGRTSFARYRSLRLITAAATLLATAGIGAAIGGTTGLVVAVAGAGKAIDQILDIYVGLFQRLGRMREAGGCLVANAVATVALAGLLTPGQASAVTAAVASALGSAAGLLYCLPVARTMRRPAPPLRPQPATLSGLARTALPLGLATAIAALAANVPRYVVAWHLDLAALGVFTAIGYVMVTVNLVASAVCQSMLPRLSRLYADGYRSTMLGITSRIAGGVVAVAGLAAYVSYTFAPEALRLVYGPGYERYALALVVAVGAAGVSGAVFAIGTALSATRQFRSQLGASCVTLAATTGLAFLLVPHGVVPAMWTLLLALVVDGAVKAVLLVRAVRADPEPRGRHERPVSPAWAGGQA